MGVQIGVGEEKQGKKTSANGLMTEAAGGEEKITPYFLAFH